MTLLNLRVMYSYLLDIHEAKKGGFVKLIEGKAPEWYYRSTELLILSFKIDIVVVILFVILSLIYHKKTLLSLVWQIFPFFITILYGVVYKELIL